MRKYLYRLQATKGVVDHDNWPHLKHDFLKPEKIRDANKRTPSDPNYNCRSLYVPEDFKQKLTPVNIFFYCSISNYTYECSCIHVCT